MLLRLCQLKSLALLMLIIFNGCSWLRQPQPKTPHELLSIFSPQWFSDNPNHALIDLHGKPQPPLFFDVTPEISRSDRFVNAIITTQERSPYAYQLDLRSGQRYYSHSYCSQSDIWNNYKGTIKRPQFSLGIIPRILDQTGEPQKIIIFGGQDHFVRSVDHNDVRVKMVGAYVEQSCPSGNCLGKNNWLSRLVFVAIDPEDEKWASFESKETFLKEIDWEQMKAILENVDGRNKMGDQSYPAIRVGQLLNFNEAMEHFKKHSIYLSEKETKKIQSGCFALYDKLWKDVGESRPEDQPAKTIEELKAKIKLKELLRKQKFPIGFAARFLVFTKKYLKEFNTCDKFVYHGNVNQDSDVFWFLNYVTMFYRLNHDGYYFDCNQKTWQKNMLKSDGRYTHDLKTELAECKERELDLAMDYMQNFLIGLKASETTYYKFLDYDNHTFGTHKKLYSWVKMRANKFDCSQDPNEAIRKEIRVFPDDISWKERDLKDIEDEMKIIY